MSLVRALVQPLVSPLVSPFVGFGGAWTPASLFASGEAGAWYDPSDLSTMFTTHDGSTPATVDGPVGRIEDKSGNGNHALQSSAGARPTLRQSGDLYWLEADGSDDSLTVSIALTQMTLAAAVKFTGAGAANHLYGTGVAANSLQSNATGNNSLFAVNSNNLLNTTTVNDTLRVVVATQSATTGILCVGGVEETVARAAAAATYNRLFVRTGTANAWGGEYYGGVIRNTPTTGDDLAKLKLYLAGKAGI